MTDGDDASDETRPEEEPAANGESDGGAATGATAEELDARLDEAAEELDAAETEADLDEVEARLDEIEADVETADLPESDEGDEDADEDEDGADPRDELESRLSELRDELDARRGPYAEEVVERVEDAATTVEETRWTETGESDVAEAVRSFTDRAGETLGESFDAEDDRPSALAETLRSVADAVESRSLDPDGDAGAIAALIEAVDDLDAALDDAQEWSDLSTREKLDAHGFYDVLGHHKHFPPERSALKEHERRGNTEMVLLALDNLGSEFMESQCLTALMRMNDSAAFDEMHQRAQKRTIPAIEALGHMGPGAAGAVETLVEFLDPDGDPKLQTAAMRALGEIGDEQAVQPLANALVSENDTLRSSAARALGLVGDARAIDPLTDVLADDAADEVRASAAWALRQIGTRRALEAAAEAADDRAYLAQNEGKLAADALGSDADARSPTA